MRICAIIPMFGANDVTRRCVDSILQHAGVELDIAVVDDCSPQPYVDERVEVIRLEQNVGYTNATNRGIMYALKKNYDFVLLLNNDITGEPNFVTYLLDAFEKDPNMGIAASARIVAKGDGTRWIENFGADLISGYQTYRETDIEQDLFYTAWIPICSALIPTSVIYQVGLLDRRMTLYCSDNDLCIRAQELGYRVALVPKSKIVHIHEHTTKTLGDKRYELAAKDQGILLEKLSCNLKRYLLESYPLDAGMQTWGKLVFDVYSKRKDESKSDQPATAEFAG